MIRFVEQNPIISGIIFIVLGILIIMYRLEKQDTFKMKDYTMSTWGSLVYSWAIVIIMFMLGAYLIFKNI